MVTDIAMLNINIQTFSLALDWEQNDESFLNASSLLSLTSVIEKQTLFKFNLSMKSLRKILKISSQNIVFTSS